MALIYPINRRDYLGEIHFMSLDDNLNGGPPDPVTTSADAQRKSSTSGISTSEVLSLIGADTEISTISGKPQPTPVEKCILYLPQSITVADKADYGTANLGFVGAGVEAAARAVGQGSSPSITSFIDSMKGNTSKDLSKLAVTKVSETFGDGISAAVKSQARVTSNPNARALFNSVPLRSFTFSFKMIPHSREEARNIKEIVTFFRKELYPDEIPLDFGNVSLSAGYKFPNRFQIKMYYGAGDQKKEVGTRLIPAYLTDLQTVYNASSMGMHYDGNFSEVDLSMTFLESRALSRKDIIQEGYEQGILTQDGTNIL